MTDAHLRESMRNPCYPDDVRKSSKLKLLISLCFAWFVHIFTMNSTVKLSFNRCEGMTMSFGGRLLENHKTLIRTLQCQ